MDDPRYRFLRAVLDRLATAQLRRLASSPVGSLVTDALAYDAATGRY